MEKTIQCSLKVVLKPTEEQAKDLRKRMCYANQFANNILYLNKQTEYKLNEILKIEFSKESEEKDNIIKKLIEERKKEVEIIHEKMKEKKVSNTQKQKLKKEKEKIYEKYKLKINEILNQWKQLTLDRRQEFYSKNKLWDWNNFYVLLTKKSKNNICSDFFDRKDIDSNNIKNLGGYPIYFQEGKKLCESTKSVINTRISGRPASMPKYNSSEILKEDEKYFSNASLKGYYPLILSVDGYDVINNFLIIWFNGKAKKRIKTDDFCKIEMCMNKYFDDVIKYDRLQITYDIDRNKFYGIFSLKRKVEIDDIEKQNICIIDLGHKNMFSYVILDKNKKIIKKNVIKTNDYKNLYFIKSKVYDKIQSKIDKFKNKIEKGERQKHSQWKQLRMTRQKMNKRTKSFINYYVNLLYEEFLESNVGKYYIGKLDNMKLNNKTNLWLRGYIQQRMKDKDVIYDIKKNVVSEKGKNNIGSSHYCPICKANPWLIGEFEGKEKLKIQMSKMKCLNEKKGLFRQRKNNKFVCPICGFTEHDDIIGALGIGLLNNLIPRTKENLELIRESFLESKILKTRLIDDSQLILCAPVRETE